MSSEPQPTPSRISSSSPRSTEPRILSEAREWIVLDKPSGWLSIPGRGNPGPVLLDWVRSRYPEALTVHRLDVETSGVIFFARGAEAHRRASLWFQKREARKQYFCLAWGRAAMPIMKIQRPIEGVPCATQVEVISQFREAFHARVRPLTGKRHQIRIHLAEEGHPLLGDRRYGGPSSVLGSVRGPLAEAAAEAAAESAAEIATEIKRVALHAAVLELPSGERFEAPLPADFSRWLAALQGSELK